MDAMNYLDSIKGAYNADPFLWTNNRMMSRYVQSCFKYSNNKSNFLELGIGHGIVLSNLYSHFDNLTVLEASKELIQEYKDKYTNASFVHTLFEEYDTRLKYDNIGMGFVLEHVDDPKMILDRFKEFLSPNGKIFIGVPSASSMHRQIGQMAGFIKDLSELSEQDIRFGHKRYFTYQEWVNLIESLDLVINKCEGLFMAPFSTNQIASLGLDESVLIALSDFAKKYPEISNSLFFEIAKK